MHDLILPKLKWRNHISHYVSDSTRKSNIPHSLFISFVRSFHWFHIVAHLTNKDVAVANADRDREKRAAAVAAGVDPRLLPELPRHVIDATNSQRDTRRERALDQQNRDRERERDVIAQRDRERKSVAHALAVVAVPIRNIPLPVSPIGNTNNQDLSFGGPPSSVSSSSSASSSSSSSSSAPRPKRATPPPSTPPSIPTYACDQCTYENMITREDCELCLKRRPTTPNVIRQLARYEATLQQQQRGGGSSSSPLSSSSPPPSSNATTWICMSCYVENNIDTTNPDAPCLLCDRPRPRQPIGGPPPSPGNITLLPLTGGSGPGSGHNARGSASSPLSTVLTPNNNNTTTSSTRPRAFPNTAGFESATQSNQRHGSMSHSHSSNVNDNDGIGGNAPLTAPSVLIRQGTIAAVNSRHAIASKQSASHRRTASTGNAIPTTMTTSSSSTPLGSTWSAGGARMSITTIAPSSSSPTTSTTTTWRCQGCSMDNLVDELHCNLCNEPRTAPAAVVVRPPVIQRKASIPTQHAKRTQLLSPGVTIISGGTVLLDISSVTVEGLKYLPKRMITSQATSLIILQTDKSLMGQGYSDNIMAVFLAMIPILPSCLLSLDATGLKSKKAISMYIVSYAWPPLIASCFHFVMSYVAHAFADLITRSQCMIRNIKLLLDRDLEMDQDRTAAAPSPSVFARNMEMNHTITSLDLSGSALGASVGFRLADSLNDNNTLILLNLSGCQLGASGGKIAEMLKKNKSIRTCDLSGNDIGTRSFSTSFLPSWSSHSLSFP
jgi:hypothetical protein